MSETTDSAAPEREPIIRDWDERLTDLEDCASAARRYALKELDGVIRTLRRQRDKAESERDAARSRSGVLTAAADILSSEARERLAGAGMSAAMVEQVVAMLRDMAAEDGGPA